MSKLGLGAFLLCLALLLAFGPRNIQTPPLGYACPASLGKGSSGLSLIVVVQVLHGGLDQEARRQQHGKYHK